MRGRIAFIGLLLSSCAAPVSARPATSQELKNFFNSSYKVCPDGTRVKSYKACPAVPPPTSPPPPPPPPPSPPPATQTCSNGSIILATDTCPVIPPPPPPPPTPSPVFSVQDVTVNESNATATVPVLKTGVNGSPSTLTWSASHGTALAGSDFVAVSGTMNVPDGVTITNLSIPIIDDGVVENTETFNVTVTPVTNATAVKPVGIVTILDNDVAPPPPPPPPPSPPTVAGWVPTVDLDGLAPIASNFDYNLGLQLNGGTGAIPPSAAPDVVGAFRFIMFEAGRNSDDAIVYPGQQGVSHPHQYYGRKGWDYRSTYPNMRASAGTVGNDYNGFLATNASGYWTPQLLDGSNNPAELAFVSAYYKRRPASDPKCGGLNTVFGAEGKCVHLPNGLRQIAGFDMLTGRVPSGNMWFNCQGPTAVQGHYGNLTLALANCPTNTTNLIGFIIELADCWDGKNVDSPNHRDHVAYMSYDPNSGQKSCPADHPYVIPQVTLGAWFHSVAGAHFSCDSMLPAGTAPGTCGHADYFENWDPTVKRMWEDNCIDGFKNASAGDLCNGKQMIGAGI